MDRYKRYTPRTYPCADDSVSYRENDRTECCTDRPMTLAMAYIKDQEFRKLYGKCEALEQGTLFEELYMPYGMGGCR